MEEAVDEDGVPAVPRVELGIAQPLEEPLGLLQTELRGGAQAEQPVPGEGPPPGEDLVEVDVAHPGLPGQVRLGHAAAVVEVHQGLRAVLAGEGRLVRCEIGVQVRRAHQLRPQGPRGVRFHLQFPPLYFQFEIGYT